MRSSEDEHQYDDIINMPHHVSMTRSHMSALDRAAQFSPFAALTGHDAAIKETARLTNERIDLDESSKELLDEKLLILREHVEEQPKVSITYFKQDEKKSGGEYQSVTNNIIKLNEYENTILLEDGTIILIKDVYCMEGKIFNIFNI